jgi:hypothetical protein
VRLARSKFRGSAADDDAGAGGLEGEMAGLAVAEAEADGVGGVELEAGDGVTGLEGELGRGGGQKGREEQAAGDHTGDGITGRV